MPLRSPARGPAAGNQTESPRLCLFGSTSSTFMPRPCFPSSATSQRQLSDLLASPFPSAPSWYITGITPVWKIAGAPHSHFLLSSMGISPNQHLAHLIHFGVHFSEITDGQGWDTLVYSWLLNLFIRSLWHMWTEPLQRWSSVLSWEHADHSRPPVC